MSLPLVQEIASAPQPDAMYALCGSEPWTVWLDSALAGRPAGGRYSFICVDPFCVLRGRDGLAEWVDPSGSTEGAEDPLTELGEALTRFRIEGDDALPPFCGGAAGYLGYELARDLERVPEATHRDLGLPDLEIPFFDVVIGWDHLEGRCWITSTGWPAEGRRRRRRAERRLRMAEAWLAGECRPGSDPALPVASILPFASTRPPPTFPVPGAPGLRSTFSPEGYRSAVRLGIERIRAGDVFQVNLSQRFEARESADFGATYERLRRASPAPFGCSFLGGTFGLMSTSPERFLRVGSDGSVETRPIKGTRPRDPDPRRDADLATELAASIKDRAENLMIVDLLRNDLSRVCRPGSVRAVDLFRVESYATVHHLVSTVEGRMREEHDCVDLLRATFPSGSVTGAPKIKAMEIIAALEPVARGPYCGAIGFFGFGGDMETSVAIRIAVSAGGRVVFHAGGAVVADSDPASEYAETLDKARALVSSFGGARA